MRDPKLVVGRKSVKPKPLLAKDISTCFVHIRILSSTHFHA